MNTLLHSLLAEVSHNEANLNERRDRDKEVNNAYFYSSTEIFESVASSRREFVCHKAGKISR